MIGVGIGVILSAYFFQGKGHLWTSWLPGNRVVDRINESYLDISPQAQCQLECLAFDIPDLKTAIESAEVDFKQSQTQDEPKVYRLLFDDNTVLRYSDIAVKDSTATLQQVTGAINCDCP